jgi:hypothetical protein
VATLKVVNPEDYLVGSMVDVDTIKLPVNDASDNSNLNLIHHTAKQPQPVKIESSAPTPADPVLKREMSNINIISEVVEPSSMATLVMVSAEGSRVRMQVKVQAKLVNGMKNFGLRMGVSHESLRF